MPVFLVHFGIAQNEPKG